MGKSEPQLPLNHQHQQNRHGSSLFVRCSMCFSRTPRLFSFKCVFILLLSVSVSLSAIFSVFRFRHRQSGFDVKDSIKQSAAVQACFRLEKPVWYLLPQIKRLEHDINDEIGVPYSQVAILSMHEAGASNWTDVVFGVLSDPISSPLNPVSLSVLRSSLVELFTQRSNLSLTTSIFGHPSLFEILKFPGGITIIPKLSVPIWMLPQVLFNFTLHNSLNEIEENFLELKEQLKSGLQLMPYESVFVQVTNKDGSTRDPPVTVQASVVSNLGSLVPERLKQLAQAITRSPPARNLGLDNSVFGKVKEISLSSYLYHTLDAPTPAPAPSPDQTEHVVHTLSPSPAISPSPDSAHSPSCSDCDVSSPSPRNGPHQSLPPLSSSPAPAVDPSCGGSNVLPGTSPMSNPGPGPGPGPSSYALSPRASTNPPPMYPKSETAPKLPPLPAVSYGTRPHQDHGYQKGLAPSALPVVPSSSSSTSGAFCCTIYPFFITLVTLHIVSV